jgi:hypothetical protein
VNHHRHRYTPLGERIGQVADVVAYWLLGLPPRPPGWKSNGRMLRIRVFGRPIQPVAFGVSLYTAILAFAILTDSALGQLLDGPIGEAVGVVCAAATAALWFGWWARRRDWLQRGLAWATAGIVATTITVVIDVGWSSVSAWLSTPVAVIAFGSWLLERADPGFLERDW